MNKIIFGLIVFVCAIIIAQPLGNNPIIIVKDLQHNGIYEIRGQTCWNMGPNNHIIGVQYIAIDKDWVQSEDCNVILLHEFGHVNHPEWSEHQCDVYANSFGMGTIHDATY